MLEIKEVNVTPQKKGETIANVAQVLSAESAVRESAREKAMPAMSLIVEVIRANPTTGQSGRLVRFLAGLYDGQTFPFDMTELRGLDRVLADACLAVLDYDRLNQDEIHYWGQVHGKELVGWFLHAGLYYKSQQRRIGRALYREKFPDGHPDEGLAE